MTAARPRRRKRLSAAELAARLGCSERTARRYQAEPRQEFEQRSLERQQPWQAEGISRSTWFRRRKAASVRAVAQEADDTDEC